MKIIKYIYKNFLLKKLSDSGFSRNLVREIAIRISETESLAEKNLLTNIAYSISCFFYETKIENNER